MNSPGSAIPDGPPIPPGFLTIQDLLNQPNEKIKGGHFFNVIGFVKDFQPPFKTQGTDFKCTVDIMDLSVQFESSGIQVVIFWPKEKMPRISGVRDIVLLRNAKLQMWGGRISLLANKDKTEFHILPSKAISQQLRPAEFASWQSFPSGRGRSPTPLEIPYIMWAHSRVKDIDLPSAQEFQERSKQAMNIKDKFSLLKDVKNGCFYDLLGEVIRIHDPGTSHLTLYLSDYTGNSDFYNYAWHGGADVSEARDGDEYGYIKPPPKNESDWPGPFGKVTLQLSLFEQHAEFVRNMVRVRDWVLLSNVNVKYGRNGGILEGYLRADRGAPEGKIQVRVMKKKSEDPNFQHDQRWKDGVQRKMQWWKKFEKQKQDFQSADQGGEKRQAEEELKKPNGKQRRKNERAAAEKNAALVDARKALNSNLNDNIRSEAPDQPISSFTDIRKIRTLTWGNENQKEQVPFTIAKYKANVRVVDYFPPNVEDFAVGRKVSEYDILSDYSGGEDTDREEDMRLWKEGKGFGGEKTWEWRFSLQVEDASDKKDKKDRIWLMVDNNAAQYLLDLDDDATDLRQDEKMLARVKEQLFKLWGDLEEKKSALLQQEQKLAQWRRVSHASSGEPLSSSPPLRAGQQPDADSDDEMPPHPPHKPKKPNSSVLAELDLNLPNFNNAEEKTSELQPRNKAFTCCIKQYGVMVEEEDPEKANAGSGRRWQRMFGLFGTHIL